MEVLFAIVCLTVVAVAALGCMIWRESVHAREIRELATIAITSQHATTADEAVRTVALTREALALDVQPPKRSEEDAAPEPEPEPVTGFQTSDGVKLEFATPLPREMMDGIPENMRIHRSKR